MNASPIGNAASGRIEDEGKIIYENFVVNYRWDTQSKPFPSWDGFFTIESGHTLKEEEKYTLHLKDAGFGDIIIDRIDPPPDNLVHYKATGPLHAAED